jgi:hypothetical protein
MLKSIWQKLRIYRKSNEQASLREISEETGVPVSTVAYHEKRREKRAASSGTDNWETAWGQNFLKRMIISVIYTFGIKGGIGSARISEHLGHLQIEGIAAVSESSIYNLTNEIIANILWYKKLQEEGLEKEAEATMKEMEVVLGIDETWLDDMLLICQDLISGYFFLKRQAKNEM